MGSHNSLTWHPPEPGQTIKKVMNSGRWIRQSVEVDTSGWQGRSGYDIAVDLVQRAHALDAHPDQDVAARRAQFLGRCADILGCPLEPVFEGVPYGGTETAADMPATVIEPSGEWIDRPA